MDDEKDAWQVLSTTYELMGQTARSFTAYKNYITLRDSVYNVDKAKQLVRIDLQSGFSRKQLADSIKQDDATKVLRLRLQKQQAYTYGGFIGLALVLLLSFFIYRNYDQQKKANRTISKANAAIQKEKQVSETLLLNILPEEVAQELKDAGKVHAKSYEHVTVVFTDFVNFTSAGEHLSPQQLVAELDTCFQAFDMIVGKYNIEKIKTVGDAYLAVSGLPHQNPDHASDIVSAAIEIRDYMAERRRSMGDRTFEVRIGIHSGSVVAGIVGLKKFAYDIWGDTVNTAARMEQNSEPGKINISEATYVLLKGQFNCVYRGKIEAKNKGVIDMYFVT
jgi:class 3 adenylate cyclase